MHGQHRPALLMHDFLPPKAARLPALPLRNGAEPTIKRLLPNTSDLKYLTCSASVIVFSLCHDSLCSCTAKFEFELDAQTSRICTMNGAQDDIADGNRCMPILQSEWADLAFIKGCTYHAY